MVADSTNLDELRAMHYNAEIVFVQRIETEHGKYLHFRIKLDNGQTEHLPAQHNMLGLLTLEERPSSYEEPEYELQKGDIIFRQYTISRSIIEDIKKRLSKDYLAKSIMFLNEKFKENRENLNPNLENLINNALTQLSKYNKKFLLPENPGYLEYFIAVKKDGQLTPRLANYIGVGQRIHAKNKYEGSLCPKKLEDIAENIDTVFLASNGAGIPGTNPIVEHLLRLGYLDDPKKKIVNSITVKLDEELGDYKNIHSLLSKLFTNYDYRIIETRKYEKKVYPQELLSTDYFEKSFKINEWENVMVYMCGSKSFVGVPPKSGLKLADEFDCVPIGVHGSMYRAFLKKGIPFKQIKGEAW